MMFFFRRKKAKGNTRRTPSVPLKKKVVWLRPALRGLSIAVMVSVLGYGVLQLNQKLAVAYWDIDAAPSIQSQIEAVLSAQGERDFWHTRAGVLQSKLLLAVPDIKSIEVSRMLPDGLRIKAKARHPLSLWENTEVQPASVMLVDADGVMYREMKAGEALDLPLLRLPRQGVAQAVSMLNTMQQQQPAKVNRLSEVIADDTYWRLNFSFGEQWRINTLSLQQDIQQIMHVLSLPQWKQGIWRLDARIPERWFIRPAKQEVI